MGQSLTVYILDQTTEQPVTGCDLELWASSGPPTRLAILRPVTNADGSYSFSDLPTGDHSLFVGDPSHRYPKLHQRIAIHGPGPHLLNVRIPPGTFISGRIVDEEGRPPKACQISLLSLQEKAGRTGFTRGWGGHHVAEDGHFTSAPLFPGRYLLQLSGVLARNNPPDVRQRIFNFLYPNSRTIEGATGFDLALAEHRSGLLISVPRPILHSLHGKLTGDLSLDALEHPIGDASLSVRFYWHPVGALLSLSADMTLVQPDRTFTIMLQPGRYSVEVMSDPRPDGDDNARRGVLDKAIVEIPDLDVNGIELAPLTL
ncbi:MAG TPA: carboxypeptidase-like regulatory domain-containing protein [Acidobacteriaceae bacterium]|nr:carboxypeptidase-like regulatory domain-containing protein [Acidobacteriaceae bacterium]